MGLHSSQNVIRRITRELNRPTNSLSPHTYPYFNTAFTAIRLLANQQGAVFRLPFAFPSII